MGSWGACGEWGVYSLYHMFLMFPVYPMFLMYPMYLMYLFYSSIIFLKNEALAAPSPVLRSTVSPLRICPSSSAL